MNNVYGAVLVPINTPTLIVGLTVPERGGYSLKGIIVSSDTDCSIDVRFNGTIICNGRVTGSVQSLFMDFSASPYGLEAFDTVTIFALQTTEVSSPMVTSTLLAEQL